MKKKGCFLFQRKIIVSLIKNFSLKFSFIEEMRRRTKVTEKKHEKVEKEMF
jgi:hypothetical protein